MELKIYAASFEEAKNKLFTEYPELTDLDIHDFSQPSNDSYVFEVDDTKVKVRVNKEVDDIIKTNTFSDSDIAFICNDGVVHTPKGSTLFYRIKELVSEGHYPILGYSNFIDASNKLGEIGDLSIPVVLDNLILTKEGNLLKGTLCRRINSDTGDYVLLIISGNDPLNITEALNYINVTPEVVNDSVIYSIAEFELSDVRTIVDNLSNIPGIIRFKLVLGKLILTGSINNG